MELWKQTATDWVAEMRALEAAHPSLTWSCVLGVHVATWDDDEGHQREEREELRELVEYVRAKLGRR